MLSCISEIIFYTFPNSTSLIICLYIHVVEKVAPQPHLYFILFYHMNIFCMGNDIPKGKCAHFPIHF